MKRKGLIWKVALALGACALASSTATAQLSLGWGSSNAVQSSLSTSSGYAIGAGSTMALSDLNTISEINTSGAAFVINRFGFDDGRIVAYGRLVPMLGSDVGLSVTTGGPVVTRSGVLLSTPIEPVGGYGADPRLGMGSRVAYSDVIVSGPRLGAGSSSLGVFSSDLGASSSSPVGSSSRLGVSGSIAVDEPFDDSRLGNWTGIGTGYGESGVESRSNMTSDIDGTTSFNLGRPYDDVSYMEDITWDGHSELNIDLALSDDQEMLGDIDVQMGPTSGNDRVALVDVDLRADDSRPLIQLGGSETLYSNAEAERALLVAYSSEDIAVPVSVVSASCDAVSLSFGNGAETVTVTSLDGSSRLESTLCALTEASSLSLGDGRQAKLVKHLNRLISDVDFGG